MPPAASDSPVCGACGSANLSLWAKAKDVEYFSVPDEFSYYRCADCDALTISPVPEDRLREIYPPAYYSFSGQAKSLAEKIKALLDKGMFISLFRDIDRGGRREEFSALDVGGGSGWLLDLAKKAEPRLTKTMVVDIDDKAGKAARAAGHRYFQGRVEDFRDDRKFDLILMLNLIEHVRDPVAVLEKMRGMLAPGGLILVKTPNYDSLDARIFRHRNWVGYHCPRHWVIFTPESFTAAAGRAGLKVKRLDLTQGAPFWSWSVLNEFSRLGLAKVSAGRPAWKHPLTRWMMLFFAAFDFARRPFMRTSQMFVILEDK
jgi:SAM-dependent methyltransferase